MREVVLSMMDITSIIFQLKVLYYMDKAILDDLRMIGMAWVGGEAVSGVTWVSPDPGRAGVP